MDTIGVSQTDFLSGEISMTFDLEKARDAAKFDDHMAITMFPLAIAEIERLQEALDESERVVAHKTKSAAHWYDEHLHARADRVQTRRVVEQQAARIQELEDAHKRSGAKYAKIINELRSSVYANIPGLKKQWDEILNAPANGKIGPDARPKCDHAWQAAIEERGYQTCLKCGECRNIEDIPRTAPAWQITEERVEALKVATGEMDLSENIFYLNSLKTMLEEAGQK